MNRLLYPSFIREAVNSKLVNSLIKNRGQLKVSSMNLHKASQKYKKAIKKLNMKYEITSSEIINQRHIQTRLDNILKRKGVIDRELNKIKNKLKVIKRMSKKLTKRAA